jgi:hypothetical protein
VELERSASERNVAESYEEGEFVVPLCLFLSVSSGKKASGARVMGNIGNIGNMADFRRKEQSSNLFEGCFRVDCISPLRLLGASSFVFLIICMHNLRTCLHVGLAIALSSGEQDWPYL